MPDLHVPPTSPAARALRRLPLLALSLLLGACASLQAPPEPVREAMHQAGLPAEALAVVAFPLEAPQRGLRLRPDVAMQPGSAMKVVTAVVALDRLGPNSRGRTELLAEQPARDGRLAVPLVLRGGADADLDWPTLAWMLRELRERHGVRELAGGIVVDRSLFQPARPELGQPPFDEQPEFPYNVIPDALHLGGSLLSYQLRSGAQDLALASFPRLPLPALDLTQLRFVDAACAQWEEGWLPPVWVADGPRLQLRGSFPRDCERTQALNVLDRQWLTEQALRAFWAELGGTLDGPVVEGVAPAGARVLVRHQDRPLAELLRPVMKSSDNALARLIYLRLGAAAARPGEATAAAADRAVREWFQAQGIADAGLVMDNGSGLSRSERISAAQLARVLQQAQAGSHGPELLATLPVAGVDGTLTRRMKGSPAEGRARLKTGTLRNVTALAGYVPDARGRLWVVAALLNDERAPAHRAVLDRLIAWIATQS